VLDLTGGVISRRRGDDPAAAGLRGPVIDLLLVLYRRVPVTDVEVTGDGRVGRLLVGAGRLWVRWTSAALSMARNSSRLSARVRPAKAPRTAASVSSVSLTKYSAEWLVTRHSRGPSDRGGP